MQRFEISQFKHSLETARARAREQAKHPPKPQLSATSQRRKDRAALEQLIKPALVKAGLDVGKLDQLLAQQQTERRRLFKAERAEAAKAASLQRAAFHHAIDEGQAALKYLSNPPADAGFGGLESLVTLPAPFLIWEWPLDGSLVGAHIEPLRSTARILLDVPVYSFDNDSGSEKREYSFYYLWENSSPYLAVVKCFSVLALTGACELSANSGIFSGDTMSLSIDAYLYPISYWLPLPAGSDIRSLRMQGDPLQHQVVLNNLTAQGGGLFGSADSESAAFSATPFGLSFQSFGGFQIPGNATALFEVNLALSYSWQGNTLPDDITADFANEQLQHSVECPLVVLQFLTQPPAMA
jgi:hypothetical protein